MQKIACIEDSPHELSKECDLEEYRERLRTLSAFRLNQEEIRVKLFEDVTVLRPDPGPPLPTPTDAMRRRAAIADWLDAKSAWIFSAPVAIVGLWSLLHGEVLFALMTVMYALVPTLLVLLAISALLQYIFGVTSAKNSCRAYDHQAVLLAAAQHPTPPPRGPAKLDAIRQERRRRVADKTTVEHWQALRASDLERATAELFAAHGYEVKQTGGRGDQGADLILRKAQERQRILVQCKGLATPASPRVVRELVGAKQMLRCDEAWLIAPNGVSDAAHDACRKARVRYLTGRQLSRLAQELNPEHVDTKS